MQRDKIVISEVEKTGEEEFTRVSIDLPTHAEAVVVIGETLDEAITRAVVVRDALRKENLR